MRSSFATRLHQRRRPAPSRARRLGAVVGEDGSVTWEDLFPGSEEPSGGGTPTEVPLRPASYDFSTTPPEYVIEPGDTMYGIALAWYGNGARWTEIKAYQTKPAGTWGPNGKYVNKDTTKFFPTSTAPGAPYAPGDVLLIPPLAAERIKARIESENPTTPAGQGNAPGNKPGGDPTKPKGSTSKGGGSAGLALGAAALAAYFAFK